MRLFLLHPEVAGRSCGDCKQWLYQDKGDQLSGLKLARTPGGPPVPRPPGTKTPCHVCPKIPAGEYPAAYNARDMSERSRKAYWHYLECRATFRFPDDPIVRANAAIIRGVEDEAAEIEAGRRTRSVLSFFTVKGPERHGRT